MNSAFFCVLYVLFLDVRAIPTSLLYDYNVPEAVYLPKEDDIASDKINLRDPIIFFGIEYETIFVYTNGFLAFQKEFPEFINIEFPLDFPLIAPFYSNVDIRAAGNISYYQTDSPALLQRATENVHESFLNFVDFQATTLLIVTWQGVGYHNRGSDKVNTYQVVIATDGEQSYVEFLYPENGIQWIQGSGESSGLPDARGQAAIISPDGKVFDLPGSGSEQVKHLERMSNMGLEGQFIFRVDQLELVVPDAVFEKKPSGPPESCAEAPTFCHVDAKCVDYDAGFCCECHPKYYGNGRHCIKKDGPLRVNGKVNGKINGENLVGLDLQSYIVMTDGRAYTAVSKIPESIGFDIQSLQILGGVIGYIFAKPIREAVNGYQLTGGIFNHTATINFYNTSQTVRIKQKYMGLDVFDQLRLEADIQGEIPNLPDDSRVIFNEYQEQYTMTGPGVIQMTSQREFRYNDPNGDEVVMVYNVDQTFVFDYCEFDNQSVGETWKLKVGKNFISYESREQIIRYGLSNKITPIGDFDPCETGRSQCTENSACVVENDSFRCICNPGYQSFFDGNQTTCTDVNECHTGQHECDYNAECVNVIGSYTCQCNPGFEGNGHVCEHAKSCENVTCFENAECSESNGVASCRCQEGFTGNGQNCAPILDHSCHVANNCSPFGYCAINPETNNYYCSCLPGFSGDGYTCQEKELTTITTTTLIPTIAQEVTDSPNHRITQTCTADNCWCPTGYRVETGTRYCIAEDVMYTPIITTTEYASGQEGCDTLNNCHPDASCQYSDQLHVYECVCNDGLIGNGVSCEPEVTSCTIVDNCDPHATCSYDDGLGKSVCVCNRGFQGDGYTCSISAISETCSSNEDCSPGEECSFTSAQQYECVCKEGYSRDTQHQCVLATGTCGGGTCVEHAECLFDDEYETFYCTCKAGYVGDGITECREKVVGCDTLNNCGQHATCRYVEEELGYKCGCDEGFFGDGFQCYAEKNCHIDPSMCDRNAACLTDANRNFICKCNAGFLGDGATCREIHRQEGNFLLLNQGMATLRIPLQESKPRSRRPVQVKPYQTAVGLDIDCLEGKVYWSDINGRAIRSAFYNGSGKVDFIQRGIGSPEGLAIDWISRTIYWTDSTLDKIEVAHLDTRLRRTLFDTGLVNPRGMAVHPQRGKIFWSDWNRKRPRIEWANADGTGRAVFLEGPDVSLPNSLTIDYETEQLCFADAGTKKIECVHIDTMTKQTIAVNCTYPFGITTTDKEIYWSDWISKKVERVDKYSLKRLTPLPVPVGGTGNKLFGLVAVPNACPSLTNVCGYYHNECPSGHICLPDGLGSKRCMCGYKADTDDRPNNCNSSIALQNIV
ncbi:unnamed protein product [Phaedon cochleariae]|uniref:Nidogen n=1 Tax=Phaedon cochleariae TaxID=80249 RepID=A0A9P0DP45_PHACE|nr:unnamed protein product [Phaedon cochleariae]